MRTTCYEIPLLVAFILVPACLSAQSPVGSVFPAMDTEALTAKQVTLPAGVSGKYTLLGMAFSKKSEEELNTWMGPVYERFLQKPTGGLGQLFSSYAHDVHIYFIPMYTGVNAVAAGAAKKQAIRHLDARLHEHVLFYTGKLQPYKDSLGFDRRDTPYFFVLDEEGVIVYATSGNYSDAKMDQILELLP
jgi:hypothetical protein